MGGQHSSCTHPKSKCYQAGSPSAQVVRVEPPELTTKQKQLLREAWERLEKVIADVGIITFLGMFKTHPQVQDIFMPFVSLAVTDESYSNTLRQHALRVMATVEKCIHRLDEPDRMRNVLEALGGRHINYNSKIEYVDVLGTQFVKAVKENSSEWNDDLENAWLALVRIMTFYVKSGWMDKQNQQLTREVTRKEYLSRLTTSKSSSTQARSTSTSSKQTNKGSTHLPSVTILSSNKVASTTNNIVSRPIENGGPPGGYHLDSRPSRVPENNSTSCSITTAKKN